MQLYSTASYQTGDLAGSRLGGNDLTGWSFAGASIRGASFHSTTDSGFTATQLYSTASYQAGDLSGIGLGGNDLTGWKLAGQNLVDANFEGATDWRYLTDAEVRGATFSESVITAAQLYSTASYQAGDLTGIGLYSWTGKHLSGWDFAGQNLTDATLSIGGFATGSNLFSASLSGANLTNARFGGADLKNADFTGARMHGTYLGFAAIDAADFRGA